MGAVAAGVFALVALAVMLGVIALLAAVMLAVGVWRAVKAAGVARERSAVAAWEAQQWAAYDQHRWTARQWRAMANPQWPGTVIERPLPPPPPPIAAPAVPADRLACGDGAGGRRSRRAVGGLGLALLHQRRAR